MDGNSGPLRSSWKDLGLGTMKQAASERLRSSRPLDPTPRSTVTLRFVLVEPDDGQAYVEGGEFGHHLILEQGGEGIFGEEIEAAIADTGGCCQAIG